MEKIINQTNKINEVIKVVAACKNYYYGTNNVTQTAAPIQNINVGTNNLDPMSEALMYQGDTINTVVDPTKPKNGVILIVDDSQITANFIKKVFEADYDVVIYGNGAGAITYCQDEANRAKIKACLLDLNMPGVDGFGVLDFFKNNNYFVKLPVVVISGIENLDVIERAKSYPIVDVLQKPFNERDAVDAINKCLATYF